MKFILATRDGKDFVKFHFKAATVLTRDRTLAMTFTSKSEANRIGMTIMRGEFVVMKIDLHGQEISTANSKGIR